MLPSMSVYPSGALLASAAPPTVAPAPGRSSTVMGWPSRVDNFSATSRATASTPPAGGYGAIIKMGRAGQDCADDVVGDSAARAARPSSMPSLRTTWRHTLCMGRLLDWKQPISLGLRNLLPQSLFTADDFV